MIAKRIFHFSLFIFTGFLAGAQICLNDIEFDKISQNKVQELIEWQHEHGIETFEELKPSMQSDSDTKGYFIHENVYEIKKGIDKVWNKYLNISPSKSWNGKKVSFGFLFSRKEHKIIYRDENVSKIDTGMVVYLNLRLMKGLINLATAFEIINIDKVNKIIEFSYLSCNNSVGIQRILFFCDTQRKYRNCAYQFLQKQQYC